jgi:polyisoprenoid-binding protein YceI
MKKLMLLAVMASGMAFGQQKKVSTSQVKWWGYKLAKTEASSHFGTVNVKDASVVLKNNQLAGGNFVLDMNSINATDLEGEYKTKLDEHLKDGDFFEANKFPLASFQITSVSKAGKNGLSNVAGNMTIKGKTQKISFPAKITVSKTGVDFASEKFTIDRQKFGIAYKSTMKDMVIKDDIDLQVSFTAK